MKQEQPSKGNSASLNIHHQYLSLIEQTKQEIYVNHAWLKNLFNKNSGNKYLNQLYPLSRYGWQEATIVFSPLNQKQQIHCYQLVKIGKNVCQQHTSKHEPEFVDCKKTKKKTCYTQKF